MSEASPAWTVRLETAGPQALRELLRGVASLGALSAAEPEDAVAALLAGAPKDSALLHALDCACLQVLKDYCSQLLTLEGRTFRVELSRLATLLSIVRRMLPRETVISLRRDLETWSGFFENFVVDRGLDLRREFFRILALSQDVAASDGEEPRGLMPLWLSICAESGDAGRYDETYLRVGLLGLRKLPLGDQFSANEDFALQGLARWAVSQRPSSAAFEREWRMLEGDFPRSPAFWAERVQLAVTAAERELGERTHHREQTFPLAAWWREDLDLHADDRRTARREAQEPPPRELHERLLRDISAPYADLAPRIDRLINDHQRYADVTGDVFYLVRTACNVGMRLIENGLDHERTVRGQRAVTLAVLAFHYDPQNAFAWGLMLRSLIAAHRVRDAEIVGWEAVRRLPERVQQRSQLALVLAEHAGRPAEAELLLRETLALFPAEAPVRTQLASVLAQGLGRPDEAVALLREAIALDRTNPYARNQLATILNDNLNDTNEASTVLQAAITDGAADAATRGLLSKLHRGQRLRARPAPAPAVDNSSLTLRTAEARRLLFQVETGLATLDAARSFLAEAAGEAYATYVAERVGVSKLHTKTTFAIAFEDALRRAEPSALRALVATARPVERALIEEAIALGEGRVVPLATGGRARLERLQTLETALKANGISADAGVTLLRDFAGSMISTGMTFLRAA